MARVLQITITTVISIILSSIVLLPGAAASASNWEQFQFDSNHSGVTPDDGPLYSPEMVWKQYTWNSGSVGIESPPIVAGELIYVHAGNGLWAFNRKSGEPAWHQAIPGVVTMQTSAPAYGDGTIFIATFDGYIRAYHAVSGIPLWENHVSQRLFQCPITCHDGFIYVGQGGSGGDTNRYYCLDTDGTLIWEYASETVGYLWSGASVVGDYLVFANHDAVLTCLNRSDGSLVDELDLYSLTPDAGKARASVSYSNGFIYTTSESGLNSGYIWKIGYDPMTGHFDALSGWRNPIGFSTSTPVVFAGRVYVGEGEHGQDGSLICLDDASGEIIWTCPVEGGVKSSPVVTPFRQEGTFIYFLTSMNDGFLYCVDENGTPMWKWNPPNDDAYILQGAVVADGMVYFGTCSGYLYAIGENPGWPQFQRNQYNSGVTDALAPHERPAVDWQAFTVYWNTHGIDVTPIIANGKVIVVDCREKVWAFDIDTGQQIWSRQLTEGARFTIGTPAAGEGKIFCATDSGWIYALDETNGSVLWSGKLTTGINQEEELNTQVLYTDGKVYVGSWEGKYFCLDANGNGTNPSIDWTYQVPGTRYDWYSSAAVTGDYVLFGNTDGLITCLNRSSGALVSSLDLSSVFGITTGSIRSGIGISLTRDRLYLTSTRGYVYAIGFDNSTGQFYPELGWYAAIDSYSQSTPAAAGGRVYVCSGDFNKTGAMYCFDAVTGAQVWRHDFGNYGSGASPAISMDVYGTTCIYVTTNNAYDAGGAYCFNEDGALLWEFVPVPGENEMMLQGVAIAEGKIFFGNDAGWLFAITTGPEYPAWDVNEDNTVNYLDMILVGNRYGDSGIPGWIREDINGDGTVNYLDMIEIGNHYGE